jgi:hypothetical protein
MPTPKTFTLLAKFLANTISANKRKFIGVIAFIAFLPVVLEKTIPEVGEIPGKALFIFLVFYFSLLVPYLVFRKQPEQHITNNQKVVAWVKAILCNIWVIFCVWFVFLDLLHKN